MKQIVITVVNAVTDALMPPPISDREEKKSERLKEIFVYPKDSF